MKRIASVHIMLIVVMIGTPIAFALAQAGVEAQGQGQAIYQRQCASCHGVDGKGNGSAAATLPAKPTDFTNKKFWGDDVDRKTEDAVINGYKSMPPIKMSQDDVKAVTDYMSRTFKQ